MNVQNLNKYITEGLIEGFVPLIAPATAFSTVVKPGASSLNNVVRVPYAQNVSASAQFSYTTGYAAESNTINGQMVTMNNLQYQRISLSDSDLALLNPEALAGIGRQAGARLAADFISASIASVVTSGNFATTASAPGTSFSSSVSWAGLDYTANNLQWPSGEGQRSIIAGTTFWQAMLSNANIVQYFQFGNDSAVKSANVKEFFGFDPYKVSFALPNSDTAIAVNPNGILLANGYHAPTDQGSQYIAAEQITLPDTGITIGFRQFYVPLLGTSYRVFDVLGGSGVGNANAVIHIH